MKKTPIDIVLYIFIFLIMLLACFALLVKFNPGIVNITSKLFKGSQSVEPEDSQKIAENELPIPQDIKISFTAIGDIMCHNSQFKDAYSERKI